MVKTNLNDYFFDDNEEEKFKEEIKIGNMKIFSSSNIKNDYYNDMTEDEIKLELKNNNQIIGFNDKDENILNNDKIKIKNNNLVLSNYYLNNSVKINSLYNNRNNLFLKKFVKKYENKNIEVNWESYVKSFNVKNKKILKDNQNDNKIDNRYKNKLIKNKYSEENHNNYNNLYKADSNNKYNFKTGLEIWSKNDKRKVNEQSEKFVMKETKNNTGFKPPKIKTKENNKDNIMSKILKTEGKKNNENKLDSKFEHLDQFMVEQILNEIVIKKQNIKFSDIAGLEEIKKHINESLILPCKNPMFFQGIRSPPKGILLFGPPGTGKTLIGKAIAFELNSTFFSITASILTSKWIGESEKLVKTLFEVARIESPSVIFIDEIDSLLTSRTEGENESSRRIKNEFLVQFEGVNIDDDKRVLLIGATNRPYEIDEAAKRRFTKRMYVPLPCKESRKQLISNIIESQKKYNIFFDLDENTISELIKSLKGYSGADIHTLLKESSMGPIREITDFSEVNLENIRPINSTDIYKELKSIKPTVNLDEVKKLKEWNDNNGLYEIGELD